MSDSEIEVSSTRRSVDRVEEDDGDRMFIESIRVPSINKETIINLSTARIKESRVLINQLNSTIGDLRTTNTVLKQFVERATRVEEQLRVELAIEKNRTVSSVHPNVQVNDSQPFTLSVHPQLSSTPNNLTVERKHNVKASSPESFSGEKVRMVNDWLAAVKRYLSLSGVEETKWVAYAVTMLTSTALNWWNSVESSTPDKSIMEYQWSEFVHLVRERFVPVDSEAAAMSKMSQWKQTGSVAIYISQFQSFNQLVPKEQLGEEMRVQMFIQGLKADCRTMINMWEPKTLHQVYKMAQKFDNSQRQGQQKFNPFSSTRAIRNRTEQQEGTPANPITFNNTELQSAAEPQLTLSVDEKAEDDGVLNQVTGQSGQYGLCHYCKSPDHYMNACPKRKLKRQGSQSGSTVYKRSRPTPYSKN